MRWWEAAPVIAGPPLPPLVDSATRLAMWTRGGNPQQLLDILVSDLSLAKRHSITTREPSMHVSV